jgi:phospholipid-binding lipoprotein MlaA
MLSLALFASGCAAAPDPNDAAAVAEYNVINDPAEPTMRTIFEFNRTFDHAILKPVAGAYKDAVPDRIREGIYNFINNLRSPIIFINDVLQGNPERAMQTMARFMVNTTVGFLGFNDQAAALGMSSHSEDFGQTLATWGAGEGPYLVLPILGPSNPRDAVGMAVDFFIDPINMVMNNLSGDWGIFALKGGRAVDFRARYWDEIGDLEKSSLDYYATVRSLYRQHRNNEIRNGNPPEMVPGPSIGARPGITGEVSQLR